MSSSLQQGLRSRISRRAALRGSALAGGGVAAALLAGCGSSSKKSAGTGPQVPAAPSGATASAVAKQPKRGGTLLHLLGSSGDDAFAAGFDPNITNESFTGPMALFYQSLLRHKTANPQESEPQLAQKWEQPSDSDYVFHLAPNIKWHNKPPAGGRALTADDVVFSLKRAGTNDPRFFSRSLVSNFDKIEAADKATVHITTKAPDVTTFLKLANSSAPILAPEVVDKAGKFATLDTAVGTGPFVLQSYEPGVSATVVRNPDYWKPGMPYLDGMKLLVQKDAQAQWAAFQAGQLDQVIVPGQEVKNFLATSSGKFFTGWWNDHAPQYVWINVQKKPFDDPRVVRALKLLIDHTEFIKGWVEVWFGPGSGYYTSMLPYLLKDWDLKQDDFPKVLEWKQPKDDAIKEALAQLSAAGFSKDKALQFELTSIDTNWSQAAATLLQSQYRQLGQGVVQPSLKISDNPTLIAKQTNGETEVSGPVARVSIFDPDQAFASIFHTGGSQNLSKYSDTSLDPQLDKQRTIFDVNQRKAAVRDILTYLIEHAPYTTPCSRNILNATPIKVQDFTPEPIYMFGDQYERIWLNT